MGGSPGMDGRVARAGGAGLALPFFWWSAVGGGGG